MLQRDSLNWRMDTQDIVIAAFLGALNAAWIILIGIGFMGVALAPILGPASTLGFAIPYGLMIALPVVGAYLRRNAGVVLLSAVLLGGLRWLFGDPQGVGQLFIWLITGVAMVAVLQAFRWPSTTLPYALAAAFGAFWGWVVFFLTTGTDWISEPKTPWVIAMFVVAMLSGAVLGGVVGVAIARLLSRVGIASVADETEAPIGERGPAVA